MRWRMLILVLALAVVTGGLLLTQREALQDWLFELSGESEPLPQVRGFFQYLSNWTRPQPQTADLSPVAHAGVNPFGVNTFLQQEVEPAKRAMQMGLLHEAGFRWIRQEFPWEDIEIHAKGDFEDRRHEPYRSAWAKYDHIVDLAEEYEVEIIARLSNPPEWSRAQGNAIGPQAPPDDVRDYGDFVEATVRRYQGRVRYYQLWNEPNIYPEWGEQPVDPEGYTELLCEGYRRAKAVDPDVVILSGALASTIELSGRDLNDFIFLQRMYDAGAGDCFDVLSMQGYSLWSAPTDHRMRPLVINYGRVEYVRDIMVQNGDAHKAIWISEMNSNAVPVGPEGVQVVDWGAFGQVSLEEQAEWAVQAYQRAQEEWPYVGVINFWYFKPADARRQNEAMYYFRMLDPDFTPLPVYDAIKAYANRPPVMYPGHHQEDHWAVSWQGPWFEVQGEEATLGGYRLASERATARVCVQGGELEVRRVPGVGEQAQLTVEETGNGCFKLVAAAGVAIDGFVVRGGEEQELIEIVVVLLAMLLVSVWLYHRRFYSQPPRPRRRPTPPPDPEGESDGHPGSPESVG